MKSKVVNLGAVKDMLAELECARQHILSGDVSGFQAVFCDTEQQETIYLAGTYRNDPTKALKASLKLSAARALVEDEPPQLKTAT